MGHSQFPAHRCWVNRPDLGVGTPTATVACSKAAKTGSCRAGLRLVIAARPVRKPHAAGAAGFPASASRLLTTARNSGESRPDAIESVSSNDHLLLNRRPPALRVELTSPVDRVADDPPDPSHLRSPQQPREGQRPAKIREQSCGLPCHRPGCYILFLPSARSPDQTFCSDSCRQALRRVRQREPRLRQRRRAGFFPVICITASDRLNSLFSCRHVLSDVTL